jgi:hypothetical protein
VPTASSSTAPLPAQPFEGVALDWVGPLPTTQLGDEFLLDITDRVMKFIVCLPCKQSMDHMQPAHVLHHDLTCVHGSPRVIISDQEPCIDNDFIRQLEVLQGITHRFTVAYRPQSNGQAEAFNTVVVTKLRMYCSDPT